VIPELAISLVTAETLDQYFDRLRAKGIRNLGEGAFSVVFDHPTLPSVVVKVIYYKDATYMSYVNLCKKHPSNPWLPKILGGPEIHVVDSDSTPMSVKQKVLFMFLEKLKPASSSSLSKASIYLGTLLGLKLTAPSDFEVFEPRDWEKLSYQNKDKDIATLASFLADHPDNLDLGPQNFMMRGSQVVFNDPVSPRLGHELW
jgi:hypothetical protein